VNDVENIYESPCWDPYRLCTWFVNINKGVLWRFSDHKSESIAKFGDIISSVNLCKSKNLIITGARSIFIYNPEQRRITKRWNLNIFSNDLRFNDCKILPNGDLIYSFFSKDRPRRKVGSVGSFSIQKGPITKIHDFFITPNGIVADHIRGILWIADTNLRKIYQFSLEEFLSIGGEENNSIAPIVTIDVPDNLGRPDGAALDIDGNYWSAMLGSGKLCCWNKNGLEDMYVLPIKNPTMLSFCGVNLKTLHITKMNEFNFSSDDSGIGVVESDIQGFQAYLFEDL